MLILYIINNGFGVYFLMTSISLELEEREDIFIREVQFPQLSLPVLQKNSIRNSSHFMMDNELLMLPVPA